MTGLRRTGMAGRKGLSLGLSSGMRVGCCLFLCLGRGVVVSFEEFREGSSGRRVWVCSWERLGSLVLELDEEGLSLDSAPARHRVFFDQQGILLPDHWEESGRWRWLP